MLFVSFFWTFFFLLLFLNDFKIQTEEETRICDAVMVCFHYEQLHPSKMHRNGEYNK